MKHFLDDIVLSSEGPIEFVDITDRVRTSLKGSGVQEGLVTISTYHTTTAVKINERCDRLQEDMKEALKRLIPSEAYRHDLETIDGRPNARSHLMSLLLNASETLPLSKGELVLGGWQSIFFVELDGPRFERKVSVRILGE